MTLLGGWTGPRLGVRVIPTPAGLDLFHPNGDPFLTTFELTRRARLERERSKRLAARLRWLGLDPDSDD